MVSLFDISGDLIRLLSLNIGIDHVLIKNGRHRMDIQDIRVHTLDALRGELTSIVREGNFIVKSLCFSQVHVFHCYSSRVHCFIPFIFLFFPI